MFKTISFGSIHYFSVPFLITGLWTSSNDTILSPFFHNLEFYHYFVTVLSQFTVIRRKIYIDDKLNPDIGEYYNGTKKVVAVTELMNFFLNSVEASFQMIIDACEFSVPALYQLLKNLVFLLKIVFFAFSYLPISLKSRFQAQAG